MRRHFDRFIAGLIDYIWRRRSAGLVLARLGSFILLALLGSSWAFDIAVPTSLGDYRLAVSSNSGTPALVIALSMIVSVVLIAVGVILVLREDGRLKKKKAVAIELRGLRDTSGDPLKDAIPTNIAGRRDQILVNILRADGRVLDPEEALHQVAHLPTSISQFEAGLDRSDVTYVVGGLAPVPFSFLMGIQLDDEGSAAIMDWDRSSNGWRPLDASDDGDRFSIDGLDKIGDAETVVLSVSVSYATNAQGIADAFPGQPVVSMRLGNLAIDGHWSDAKQTALAKQFFDVLRGFCSTKIAQVNLVLAAPNSVVIRFGRIYDKRNLPALTVWQYENGQTPPYPWGVAMPVAGKKASIMRR